MSTGCPKVLVSQRVITDTETGEHRDALDQRWPAFLAQCGAVAIAVPNVPGLTAQICDSVEPAGIVLTGGNDLVALGGTAPERDAVEHSLIEFALGRDLPVIGVCRGMQMIQSYFGVALGPVEGHVTPSQEITFDKRRVVVNSYHLFGTRMSIPALRVCALADDGVVKAVRGEEKRILGVMWHPEREEPVRASDIALFKSALGAKS